MAIRIQNSTIIDDSRNIVDAGIGTFTNALNVGAAGTIFSVVNRPLNENVLTVRNTSNASALEVTGIGSVGIGTINPQRTLHVEGNGILVSSASNTIFSAEAIVGSSNILSIRNTSNLPAVEVTGVGSMGVGIATPRRTLHVEGNGILVSSGITTVFSAETYSGSGNLLSVVGINSYPAMEISGIGSVGIGIATPTRALHVEGNGLLFTNNNNTVFSVETFSNQSDKVLDVRDNLNNTIVGVTTNAFTVSSPLQSVFTVETTTSGSSILSIKNTFDLPALEVTGIGSVGIGIATPTRALHVDGNGIVVSSGQTSVFSVDTFNTTGVSFEVLNNSGIPAMQVTGVGSIGVGRTNPTRSLHVEGSGILVSNGISTVFSVDTFGGGTNTFEILGPTNDILLGISTNVVSLAGTTGRVGVGSTLPNNELEVIGDFSAYDLRIQSASERLTLVDGNTVTLNYSLGGGNVAICTNPSGPITLNVIGIPTDTTFNSRSLTFSVIVNQGATGYACTTVTLNGVTEIVKYPGGIVATPSTSCYDIFNFVGINTVGAASTTSNYEVLGIVNGNFK